MLVPRKNWRLYLSLEDEAVLNEILRLAAKHRGAYKNANETAIAQVWCALIEIQKEIKGLDERLKRLERILGGIASRVEEEREKLLKSLESL